MDQVLKINGYSKTLQYVEIQLLATSEERMYSDTEVSITAEY